MVVEPVDQRVLLREPAPVDELPRRDRVEEQRGRHTGVHPSEHVADVLAPVPLAHAEGECRGAHPVPDADRAVAVPEAVLDVEGLPGAPLLVLREGHAVVRVVIALVSHVARAGHRAALAILGKETVGASDRGVGVVVGAECPRAAFIPISSRTGPFTTAIDAMALELLLRAVTPVD